MLIDRVSALRDRMNDDGVTFCFTGYLSEDVLTGIAKALRDKLELEDVDINTAKGVFSVVIELSQNIIRYSAEQPETVGAKANNSKEIDLRYGVLAVGHDGENYYVACGNLITKSDSKELDRNLAHIQGLDRKELKSLYKDTLRSGPPEGSKGAGVGFIEIALRATNGFEYGFEDSDSSNVFFALKAKI